VLREQYTQSKHEAQRELAQFFDERVTLYGRIESVLEEYECLKVLHAEEAQQYANKLAEEKKVVYFYIGSGGECFDLLCTPTIQAKEKLESTMAVLQSVLQSLQGEKDGP